LARLPRAISSCTTSAKRIALSRSVTRRDATTALDVTRESPNGDAIRSRSLSAAEIPPRSVRPLGGDSAAVSMARAPMVAASGYALAAVRTLSLRLSGLVAVEPTAHRDARGFFCETYRREWNEEL